MKELNLLETALPLSKSASIFLRADEDNLSIMKALVIGPEGTPYANGCFEFDILLSPSYPRTPPRVSLVTTASGRVRFNPNLYGCGKVSLKMQLVICLLTSEIHLNSMNRKFTPLAMLGLLVTVGYVEWAFVGAGKK